MGIAGSGASTSSEGRRSRRRYASKSIKTADLAIFASSLSAASQGSVHLLIAGAVQVSPKRPFFVLFCFRANRFYYDLPLRKSSSSINNEEIL